VSEGPGLQGGRRRRPRRPHLHQAILFAGEPIGEPVVQRGPFVMNTMNEIVEAYRGLPGGEVLTFGASRPNMFAGRPNVFASQPNMFAGRPNVFASRPNVFAGRPNVFAGRPNVFAG
jgi:hypothetical protein